MSLFIEIYVGSKDNRIKVAECIAHNNSQLADVSDYVFRANEFGNPSMGIPKTSVTGKIENHKRNSSVWTLVEKFMNKVNKDNGYDSIS